MAKTKGGGINSWKFMHKMLGTDPEKKDELQPKEVMSYSVAGLGQNLISGLIGSYITVFYTNSLMLPAMFVAIMMLCARVFDAFNDPIMGSIVDHTRSKWGKCRPYLLFTPVPIAILTILCFTGGIGWSVLARCIYVTVIYVIWSVAYTIVDVPYWGLATGMTKDTNVRGTMLTIARLFCTLGAGIISLVVPAVMDMVQKGYRFPNGTVIDGVNVGGQFMVGKFPGSEEGYSYTVSAGVDLQKAFLIMAVVIVVIAIPSFLLGFKNSKERYYDAGKPATLAHNFKLLSKNKPLMLIVLSGILGGAKIVFTYTGIFFATYNIPFVMQGEEFLGMSGAGLNMLITMSIVPGGLIASLLVPMLSRKFGKRNVYIWSHIIGGGILLGVYFIGWDAPWKLLVNLAGLVIIGVPSGFANILTYAMIGDTVDYLEYKTGERAEGICFAMQTLINKIGMAFGAFLAAFGLSLAGIVATDPSTQGGNNIEGLNILYTISILVCALSNILSAIPLFFYKFTEKEQARVVELTKLRKLEQAAQGELTGDAVALAVEGMGEVVVTDVTDDKQD